jgi:hypothetical protein
MATSRSRLAGIAVAALTIAGTVTVLWPAGAGLAVAPADGATTSSSTSSTSSSSSTSTTMAPPSPKQITVVGNVDPSADVKTFTASGADIGRDFVFNTVGHDTANTVARAEVDANTPGKEIVVGSGPNTPPVVQVFSDTGALIRSFHPYDTGFMGGVSVAVGDVDNDGMPEIVTGAGPGGGPDVRVFATDGTLLNSFFAYDAGFRGGVNVAAGNVNASPGDEIVTAAGPGGGPRVRVLKGDGTAVGGDFFAYDAGFTGGVNVAVGNPAGSGLADIITGAGPGGGPHVRTFKGDGTALAGSFFAYDTGFTGGVRVAAANLDSTPGDEIVTGAGPGGGPHVRVFGFTTGTPIGTGFMALDPTFRGGVWVAATSTG